MTFQQTMPVPRAMTMPAPRAKFCTGFGQYDTHSIKLSSGKQNTAALAGQPYTGVTEADILAMVQDPPSVAKTKAQWFIPSDYRAHDGRDQRRSASTVTSGQCLWTWTKTIWRWPIYRRR